MLRKIFLYTLSGVVVMGLVIFVAFKLSPRPAVFIVRWVFTKNAKKINEALKKYVPENISTILNEHYDSNDADALLDVYFPSGTGYTGKTQPTIVWIHGGGWVSGNKGETSNYYRILAARGFTVVSVDYSLAPGKTYPTPVRQVNAALQYLAAQADRLRVNKDSFVLAGDSGGANIAAQEANILGVPAYAELVKIKPSISRSQIAGVLLYCGPYDIRSIRMDSKYNEFLKAVAWAYSGRKDFMDNPEFATISVAKYVNSNFPPAFISVGNGDPLEAQSRNFAASLGHFGVVVDTLFFSSNYKPEQKHEYQFNMDSDEGRLALERSVSFLTGLNKGVR